MHLFRNTAKFCKMARVSPHSMDEDKEMNVRHGKWEATSLPLKVICR